jgi:hypothetical protein
MTTICTDRELPDAVNDFGSTGIDGSMFEALAEADITSYNLIIKHNNSDLAKLAMGPVSCINSRVWGGFFLSSQTTH